MLFHYIEQKFCCSISMQYQSFSEPHPNGVCGHRRRLLSNAIAVRLNTPATTKINNSVKTTVYKLVIRSLILGPKNSLTAPVHLHTHSTSQSEIWKIPILKKCFPSGKMLNCGFTSIYFSTIDRHWGDRQKIMVPLAAFKLMEQDDSWRTEYFNLWWIHGWKLWWKFWWKFNTWSS